MTGLLGDQAEREGKLRVELQNVDEEEVGD
jgi:hypothetical protein